MSYWEDFYRAQAVPKVPSQFAVFALVEATEVRTIIEFGCGNGRDALEFQRHGKCVVAVDQAEAALSAAQQGLSQESEKGLRFIHGGIDAVTPEGVAATPLPRAIYARFFLHAISDVDLVAFFSCSAAVLNADEQLFLEYRTPADKGRKKVTGEHFRAYRSAEQVSEVASREGFSLRYQVEGTGYAKYLDDDAYVTRQIFSKS